MSERKEARQAEALLQVSARWLQATGEADAAVRHATGSSREGEVGNRGVAAPTPERSADAAKPTLCRHVDTERMPSLWDYAENLSDEAKAVYKRELQEVAAWIRARRRGDA